MVKKNIARWKQDYGPNSSCAKLSEELGIEITYLTSTLMRFTLEENTLQYDSRRGSINFEYPMLRISFKFSNRRTPVEQLTKTDLHNRIATAKLFYDILSSDKRIDFDILGSIYVDYDEEKQTATFEGNIKPLESEVSTYITIHNRKVPVTTPVMEKIRVNLTEKVVDILNK